MTPREELQALAECAMYAQKAVKVSKKLWEGHPKYPHELKLYDDARVFAGVAQRALQAACTPEVLLEALRAEATEPPADYPESIDHLLRTAATNTLYASDFRRYYTSQVSDEELETWMWQAAGRHSDWMAAQAVWHGVCRRNVMHPWGVSLGALVGGPCACGAVIQADDGLHIKPLCLVRRSSLTGTK